MKKITTAIFLLLFSLSVSAQEGPRSYAAFGGSLMTFEEGSDSVEPINIFGRIGHDFNENIGIGFEGSFSLIEDDFLGIDYSVTTLFLYLKASLPVSSTAKVYAMIGPSNVELTGSLFGFSASTDDSDTGVGFGFENRLDSYSISVDYINYYDDFDVDVNAINVGLTTYF